MSNGEGMDLTKIEWIQHGMRRKLDPAVGTHSTRVGMTILTVVALAVQGRVTALVVRKGVDLGSGLGGIFFNHEIIYVGRQIRLCKSIN